MAHLFYKFSQKDLNLTIIAAKNLLFLCSPTTQLLIRHSRILLPNSEFLTGDVRIQQGKIILVASEIAVTETDRVIDATGLTLLPEVIDPQVHLREPDLEHKEELLRQDKPSWVTAEVTPQNLLLNISAYEQIGTLAQFLIKGQSLPTMMPIEFW